MEARRRVTMNTASLAPHLRNDSSIEPPYSSSQISETAFHREILNIYRSARPETKRLYDLGHDGDGIEEENCKQSQRLGRSSRMACMSFSSELILCIMRTNAGTHCFRDHSLDALARLSLSRQPQQKPRSPISCSGKGWKRRSGES